MDSLRSKPRVLVAVSGSIAGYKAADIVSQLVSRGCEVRCVMTESAQQFVTPVVLETLSGNPVFLALFGPGVSGTEHIRLARWPDLIVFAPATAHLIAKLSLGLADDLVTTVALASEAPWLVAPAMNTVMWNQAVTQGHVSALRARGAEFVDPIAGTLACREEGIGKLATPDAVVDAAMKRLASGQQAPVPAPEPAPAPARAADLAGQRILITAGPTISRIDAVRYVTNGSTGRMGAALAEEALARGAEVIYVLGIDKGVMRPRVPAGAESRFHLIEVETAEQMLEAAIPRLRHCQGVIATAAVLDYRVAEPATGKLKRSSAATSLAMLPSADVLGGLRAAARHGQWFFGFAAESHNVENNALSKLESKGLDFIFANRIADGFGTETNAGLFLGRGLRVKLESQTKPEIAARLWDLVSGATHS